MRLRQARALLEAAAAIEALGLGFELHPLDYDHPQSADLTGEDHLDGGAEFNDPDTPDRHTRYYGITLSPGPGTFGITAQLVYGLGPDPDLLLVEGFQIWQHGEGSEALDTGGVGTRIAALVASAVNEHEEPYRVAYLQRAVHG